MPDEIHKLQVELVARWGVSGDPPRSTTIATLLENQSRTIARWEEEDQLPAEIDDLLGENWRESVYRAITDAWSKSLIFDICSVQPFVCSPVRKIFHLLARNTGMQGACQPSHLPSTAMTSRRSPERTG